MWTLSGFADEISPDPVQQCTVLRGLDIGYLEMRSAWDTRAPDLTDGQLARLAAVIDEHGMRVSSIGSPTGKIPVDGDFAAHLRQFDRVLGGGRVCVAGAGDGEWPQTLRALRDDGYDGFFSMEPHLAHAGPAGGFSGPDLFATATEAFTGLLRAEGIGYR